MNQKPRPRRANTRTTPVGNHWTLTRVVKDPNDGSIFGFALSDDNEEGYISRLIAEQHQIAEEDIGAGFHATFKPSNSSFSAVTITEPIVFDDEEPSDEVDELLDRLRSTAKLADCVDGLVGRAKGMEEKADILLREAENFRNVATFLHNDLKEAGDWLDENYPEDEG